MEDEKISLDRAVNDRNALQTMLEGRGWQVLMGIAEGQIGTRTNSIILRPLHETAAIYEQEFSKGEIAGIKLFQNMPQNAIDALSNDIVKEQRQQKAAKSDDNEVKDNESNSNRNAP